MGAFVRTVTTLAIGSVLWTKLGLFTWLTAVLVYVAGLGIGWSAKARWQSRLKFKRLRQRIALSTIDIFDRGISLTQAMRWLSLPWRFCARLIRDRFDLQQWSPPLILLAVIGTIAVLGFAILLRFEHPLTEFRYGHPDTYSQLLITQQILAREPPPVNYLPIFPSLAAFISALSGIHPVRVVSLLGAIFGTLLVLGVGYTVRNLTKSGAAALAATYSLGAYLFAIALPSFSWFPPELQQWLGTLQDNLARGLIRSWAVSDLEVGALFVLLGLGCSTQIFRARQRTEAIVNTCCCLLLVAAIAPSLLLLCLFAGFGIIFGRQMALFTLSTAWVGLSLLSALPDSNFPLLQGIFATLPIGLSLLVGLLFIALATVGRLLLASWSAPVCLTLVIAITLNFCLPPPPQINYLEYDAAARKAVEIGYILPHHQWTVVAPIEQLSQVYGRGWYEDLAQFTAKYRNRVGEADFQFPIATQLLIFAEKRPFNGDRRELPVSYSVLQDPTYRHYRSSSGRRRLAQATIQMCETYRQHHPLSKIYYEDERLRIYQFPA